ncbi:nucleotidyltransferase family protein [Pseudobutyrivibrio xylanivorans]|uniref:tRNA(Met) cytidine acetate ligase n=1 Tax=Pseudobutyrivibrio xylanivorans TaxID=185007 RepID=A0A5P6VTB0_PSEXY|nr:nucleotidyltransferase family protein [Pseudobutyrivibrio xylanivorans]QFJ55528.1 nucleotidyltransferase family protein [Pseudobutyrivibrio xylanivorans]
MVVGIVAEYNPFHNGHKLQIEYAKNVLKADQVVVAMSGSFTQRGEIACFDKYTRAHAALLCGADVILEIPTIFATSSAREFASAGVQLLASTGVIDSILFSAECPDRELFISEGEKLVELENSGAIDNEINTLVSNGISYAAARAKALKTFLSEELLSSPNNILGLEYCRYIFSNNIKMDIQVMKRQGNEYNDLSLTGQLSSASSIRQHFKLNHEFLAVPEEVKNLYKTSAFVSSNDISPILHYKLLTKDSYEDYHDCSHDLSDRIRNNLKDFVSYTQFCELLKTKNYEYSRISRVLCHILLGLHDVDFQTAKANEYITYIRMLGFSKNGNSLLGKIKKNASAPLVTEPSDIVNKFDIRAADIHRVITIEKTSNVSPNEYTRKFSLVNI